MHDIRIFVGQPYQLSSSSITSSLWWKIDCNFHDILPGMKVYGTGTGHRHSFFHVNWWCISKIRSMPIPAMTSSILPSVCPKCFIAVQNCKKACSTHPRRMKEVFAGWDMARVTEMRQSPENALRQVEGFQWVFAYKTKYVTRIGQDHTHLQISLEFHPSHRDWSKRSILQT